MNGHICNLSHCLKCGECISIRRILCDVCRSPQMINPDCQGTHITSVDIEKIKEKDKVLKEAREEIDFVRVWCESKFGQRIVLLGDLHAHVKKTIAKIDECLNDS